MIAMTNTKTPCPNCGGRGYTRHFAGIDHFLNEWDGWEMEKRECRECQEPEEPIQAASVIIIKYCGSCGSLVVPRHSLMLCSVCEKRISKYGCSAAICLCTWCQLCYNRHLS